MADRESILKDVRRNQPAKTTLPPIPDFSTGEEPLSQFISLLERVKVRCITLDDAGDLDKVAQSTFPDGARIYSTIEGVRGTRLSPHMEPHQLDNMEVLIMAGEFGVAENGAIWVPETNLVVRASAFITQHLVLVLPTTDIVQNMHHAYDRIHLNSLGYGVFIAGPSKTADIEQVLVVGAHGPKSLTVLLT